MDYHLERRIRLDSESEYKNLYKWSLQETLEDGTPTGQPQIPWPWTMYFTATELVLTDRLSVEPDYAARREENKFRASERQSISGQMRPGHPRDSQRWGDRPRYSMFGTARQIESFSLYLEPLQSEDDRETCSVFGSVSHTFALDLENETTDDSLNFHLSVRPSTFGRWVDRVERGSIDAVVLRLSGVRGFYSPWSPSIFTTAVKVLTPNGEHVVETSGSETEGEAGPAPPRLGEVREFELYLNRRLSLETVNASELDLDEDETARQPIGSGESLVSPLVLPASVVNLLSSTRTAAWTAAVLLLLALLSTCHHAAAPS